MDDVAVELLDYGMAWLRREQPVGLYHSPISGQSSWYWEDDRLDFLRWQH